MMKNTLKFAVVAAAGLTLVACQSPSNQAIGVGTGAVVGGLLGNQIGSGTGNVVATIAGAAIGGFIGGAIGQQLDEADRIRAQQAQVDAVSQGRPTSWRGQQSDAYGSVEPGPEYTSSTGKCREYSHTIFIGGRPQKGTGTACQRPDGAWDIVS
jgi:surface antigen